MKPLLHFVLLPFIVLLWSGGTCVATTFIDNGGAAHPYLAESDNDSLFNIATDASHGMITITNTADSSEVTAARGGVELTITPRADDGYVLKTVTIVTADSDTIAHSGGVWFDLPATFTMPEAALTVKAEFVSTGSLPAGIYIVDGEMAIVR